MSFNGTANFVAVQDRKSYFCLVFHTAFSESLKRPRKKLKSSGSCSAARDFWRVPCPQSAVGRLVNHSTLVPFEFVLCVKVPKPKRSRARKGPQGMCQTRTLAQVQCDRVVQMQHIVVPHDGLLLGLQDCEHDGSQVW